MDSIDKVFQEIVSWVPHPWRPYVALACITLYFITKWSSHQKTVELDAKEASLRLLVDAINEYDSNLGKISAQLNDLPGIKKLVDEASACDFEVKHAIDSAIAQVEDRPQPTPTTLRQRIYARISPILHTLF